MASTLRRFLLTTGTTAVCLTGAVAAPGASHAAQDGVAPVCATNWSRDGWYGAGPTADPATLGTIQGQTQFVDPYFVARGTLFECASQMHQHSVANAFAGFRAFPANVVPNVIDAAGGDDQPITVTLNNAVQVLWGQCLPRVGLGTVECPPGAVNPANSGTILYRVREADGFFRGPWVASRNGQSPGFQLQKLGTPCAITSTSCTYTVKFTRDTTNLPAVRKDIQLLLQFNVRMMDDAVETEAEIAVPIVVVQQGGGAQPGPGQPPTAGPATTGGGVSSAGVTPDPPRVTTVPAAARTCLVPRLTKVKLSTAKRRAKAAGCTVGAVSRTTSHRVAKGRVVRSSPRAGATVAAGTKVNLVVSRGHAAGRPR